MQTFNTLLQEPTRFSSSEPFGRLVNHAEGVVLDGSGVGDTALVNVALPLQDGYFFKLNRLIWNIQSAEQNWINGSLVTFVAPGSGEPSIVIDTPLTSSAYIFGQTTAASNATHLSVGGSTLSGTAGANDVYGMTPYGHPPGVYGNENPQMQVASASTAIAAGTMSWWVEWLAYDINQTDHSGLYWEVPVNFG